jgi:hypothetical protein
MGFPGRGVNQYGVISKLLSGIQGYQVFGLIPKRGGIKVRDAQSARNTIMRDIIESYCRWLQPGIAVLPSDKKSLYNFKEHFSLAIDL